MTPSVGLNAMLTLTTRLTRGRRMWFSIRGFGFRRVSTRLGFSLTRLTFMVFGFIALGGFDTLASEATQSQFVSSLVKTTTNAGVGSIFFFFSLGGGYTVYKPTQIDVSETFTGLPRSGSNGDIQEQHSQRTTLGRRRAAISQRFLHHLPKRSTYNGTRIGVRFGECSKGSKGRGLTHKGTRGCSTSALLANPSESRRYIAPRSLHPFLEFRNAIRSSMKQQQHRTLQIS